MSIQSYRCKASKILSYIRKKFLSVNVSFRFQFCFPRKGFKMIQRPPASDICQDEIYLWPIFCRVSLTIHVVEDANISSQTNFQVKSSLGFPDWNLKNINWPFISRMMIKHPCFRSCMEEKAEEPRFRCLKPQRISTGHTWSSGNSTLGAGIQSPVQVIQRHSDQHRSKICNNNISFFPLDNSCNTVISCFIFSLQTDWGFYGN